MNKSKANKAKSQQQAAPIKPAHITKSKGKEEATLSSSKSRSAVKSWVNMVCNPSDSEVVRSPSTISYLATKTRIILNSDVPYAETLNGYFSVIVRPSAVFPLIIAKNPQRFPSVGNTELSVATLVMQYSNTSADPGFPISGSALVKSSTDQISMQLQTVPDAAVVSHNAFLVNTVLGNNVTIIAQNDGGTDYYLRPYVRVDGANWAATGSATFCPKKSSAILLNSTPGSAYSAITVAIVDKSGTLTNPGHDYTGLSISFSYFGYVPISVTAGSVANFVNPSIVNTAGVENCRVTAMSLLITNMGSATHDGGEIVMASTRQSTINSAKSTQELMDTLKALPEANRVYSGIMRGGGYTFYCPDDMTSYEPHPYDTINFNDNACVCAGRLDPDGIVRVRATYIVEWYTKSQLFERSMGPTWTAEFKLAHSFIQRGRMASGNEDHESMTRRIASNVSKVWNWAWEHRAQIELGADIAMSLLL